MSSAPFSYRIVKLANGTHSVHSLAEAETFHPVVGPMAEAEALYVRQLRLPERASQAAGEFVIWDVGLGAAANPITFLAAAKSVRAKIRLVSFDHTLEPLRFALQHTDHLPYLRDFEAPLATLLSTGRVNFNHGGLQVEWEARVGDFPTLLSQDEARSWPKPHAVMYDAYSPAKNPAMWTQPVFAGVYRLLDPQRPCAMPTYSRSTMLRVTLLLAGFYVGAGHATGEKEETTVASNTLELLAEPLDHRWLQRAHRSHSAEPLWQPVYRQAALSAESREKLHRHPQFAGAGADPDIG